MPQGIEPDEALADDTAKPAAAVSQCGQFP
jgi:hypothetical protein